MKINKKLTSVFSLFSTGVTIITNGTSKKQYFGCTVNSFTSLSLDPPQFLFCLGNENGNLKSFKIKSPLNVNFLSKSQENLSNKFAGDLLNRWNGVNFSKAKNKVPFFKNSLGLIESYVEKKVISGDHTIIICRVTNFEIFSSKKPLIYFKSKYRSI
jgi:flavin reductase (DIM6/NTAB) family NADH-FMN oxidoreductase RutF